MFVFIERHCVNMSMFSIVFLFIMDTRHRRTFRVFFTFSRIILSFCLHARFVTSLMKSLLLIVSQMNLKWFCMLNNQITSLQVDLIFDLYAIQSNTLSFGHCTRLYCLLISTSVLPSLLNYWDLYVLYARSFVESWCWSVST